MTNTPPTFFIGNGRAERPDLFSTFRGMALQPDGQVVVVGSYSDAGTAGLIINRYHVDGVLNRTYGTDGRYRSLHFHSVSCVALRSKPTAGA